MAALRDGTLAPQFVASFFDSATGVFDSGSQTTFALALKHAAYLAPALAAVGGGVDALVAGLVGDIAARGTTQTVGIIGAKVRARAAAAATLPPSRRSRPCANEPLRARPAMVHRAEEPRARQGAIGFRSSMGGHTTPRGPGVARARKRRDDEEFLTVPLMVGEALYEKTPRRLRVPHCPTDGRRGALSGAGRERPRRRRARAAQPHRVPFLWVRGAVRATAACFTRPTTAPPSDRPSSPISRGTRGRGAHNIASAWRPRATPHQDLSSASVAAAGAAAARVGGGGAMMALSL